VIRRKADSRDDGLQLVSPLPGFALRDNQHTDLFVVQNLERTVSQIFYKKEIANKREENKGQLDS